MVVSAVYFNSEIDGQVNGTSTKRSPDSTFKPFIYGLAMDQSLIHPSSILKDALRALALTAQRILMGVIGPITATDALIR